MLLNRNNTQNAFKDNTQPEKFCVLTALQQCYHSRETSVEETDSDLKKSLVSGVDRVSQDYKSPQGRSVPTIKRAWSFYCNLIRDEGKGQLRCVFAAKKKILITVSKLYSFFAIEVQIIGVKAQLGLDYLLQLNVIPWFMNQKVLKLN